MVTQKMISLKLDTDQLVRLDSLCDELGCNRNKLINFAVKMLVSSLSEHKKCALLAVYSMALKEID